MILTIIPHRSPGLFGSLALLALLAGSIFAQQPASSATVSSTSVNDTYRIRTGDKISVKFLYHEELNEPAVIVRPDGFITLSLIDEVSAKGLTVAELKTIIEKAYSESLLNPVVSINLIEFVAPHIYVGGQVAKPGSYDLRAGQTLMQAVILAGGFTREANRKMVLHARPDGGGKVKMAAFNMMEMLSESAAAHEVLLQDGDYVFVPDSKLTKISRAIEVFRALMPGIGIGLGY